MIGAFVTRGDQDTDRPREDYVKVEQTDICQLRREIAKETNPAETLFLNL